MSLPATPTFSAFFEAAFGYPPYPWQARLAQRVHDSGAWPATVGVPTGCGKTATMAIALWCIAAEAHLPVGERTSPRRVVMVVDRRTIVDQSFRDAQALHEALRGSNHPALAAVRQRLCSLMAPGTDGRTESDPFQLALLRGGVPRDDSWARRPDQAILAVSTVDQVGSRLLFRGYGVGERMLSVHAGLLGNDTLFLLDEVHLSRPFEKLLTVLRDKYRSFHRPAATHERPRWSVVSLSATSGDSDRFDLDGKDKSHEALSKRLRAPKAVRLAPTSTATHGRQGEPSKKWVKAFVDEVAAQVAAGARAVGVVVNRVDVARAIHHELGRQKRLEVETQLVTGRMRPVDRSIATRRLMERAGGKGQSSGSKEELPYVCVATQTIEAGADLDFDAMVTEVASLDALVQRFGRVNRTGRLTTAAPITVLAPKGLDKTDDDPIYGDAMGKAWAWLEARLVEGQLDASPAALSTHVDGDPSGVAAASAPQVPTSVLAPDQLDALAQTSPRPRPSPPVDDFLHGRQRPRRELTVVWRADLPACPSEDDEVGAWVGRATELLRAVPPAALETLSLPLHAVRAWRTDRDVASFSDVEAEEAGDGWVPSDRIVGLSWDGDRARPVKARELYPDMVLVLPAVAGGLAGGNFAPDATDLVQDTGDLARTVASGRVHLRLDLEVHGMVVDGERTWPKKWPAPPAPPSGDRSVREVQREARGWLRSEALAAWCATAAELAWPTHLTALLPELVRQGGGVEVLHGPDPKVITLIGRQRLTPHDVLRLADGQATLGDDGRTADDENGASRSSRAVALGDHLRGVGGWARRLAEHCLDDAQLIHDLALAGEWHDLGKAHPSFQTMLFGGDDVLALAALANADPDHMRAKSDLSFSDRGARKRARERSGLPNGFRHEMASVSMLESSEAGRTLLARANDPDLVLHLVGSHHGYARPFAKPEDHAGAPAGSRNVRLQFEGLELQAPADHGLDLVGSGVAARFFDVQQRYGWHTLAYLEAILRLADHRRSEEEERTTERPAQDSAPTSTRSHPGPSVKPSLHAHELTGLDGANPLAFLAALGSLAALDRDARERGECPPKLSWAHKGTWRPTLHTVVEWDDLIMRLDHDRQRCASDPAIHFEYEHKGSMKADVKPSPEQLHKKLEDWAAAVGSPTDAAAFTLAWFRGFVSEGVVDGSGAAKPTPLHFTAGRQLFLAMAQDLSKGATASDMEAAMMGPWSYDSKLPVFGWDATESRDYALRATDPAGDKKTGNAGAEWLALRSLILFGTARERGRQQAPGTDGRWKKSTFTWPIWEHPLEVREAGALVAHPELVQTRRPSRARQGVPVVFRSRIVRSDQGGYGSMLPPSTT